MTLVSSQDIASMKADQAQSLHDSCIIQTYTAAADGYGQMVVTYVDGAAIACGYKSEGGQEKRRRDGTVLVTDATLRLPLTASIGVKDRVKLTKRYGVTLGTALVFEVVGLPQPGPTGYVVELKAVG